MIELGCLEKVAGSNDKGDLVLFALSTCPWCRKTREFLEKNNIPYRFVYVDTQEGISRSETVDELKKWNPKTSLPTLVIDNSDVMIGFNEPEYRERFL